VERLDRLSAGAIGPVLAAAVAGLLFTPVFGLTPLLLPVGVPALAVLAVTWLASGLVDWRPLLTSLAGLLAATITVAGLPTGGTLGALGAGVTRSWRLVLQSTWPARPDPELLILVALLVTAAAVLGVEILLRLRAPLLALLPSLAVVVLSQMYAAAAPGPAVLAALAYAVAAAIMLVHRAGLVRLAVSGAVGLLAAGTTLVLLPDAPARWSLHQGQAAPLDEVLPANPLDEIAYRMEHPATEVFRVDGGSGVDRWPLLVMDDFDGVTWRTDGLYRRLGAELPPGPEVTVEASRVRARIMSSGTGGPWLPSQTWPAAVTGVAPRVAPRYGTLALPGSGGVADYRLEWWQPQIDAATLSNAAIDPDVPGAATPVPGVPAPIQQLADRATQGLRPSFRTALLLETYLRTNYNRAEGEDLPTGHAWPQLAEFLFETRRGTSEQFAAAYVVLARTQSIPARLAVGFRAPAPAAGSSVTVVTNREVLAWPEVAVEGVGWVPLDPYGKATGAALPPGTGLAAQTEAARQQLPPLDSLRESPIAPTTPGGGSSGRDGGPERVGVPWTALLALPLIPLLGWPLGVPLAWALRSWRRRRRGGQAAVVGAWKEVRDRLRAHGLPVTPGMTVRDLGAVVEQPAGDDLRALAVVVDRALWSGDATSGSDVSEAWACVGAVRRGLARRGWAARTRALLNARPLLPGGRPANDRRRRRGSPSADSTTDTPR
jgi:transglutaminase-like putative cysteine protease